MKILNFGSMNIDYVYEVAHMMRPGETQSSLSRSVYAGGKGLNQSIAIRAGASVYRGQWVKVMARFVRNTEDRSIRSIFCF